MIFKSENKVPEEKKTKFECAFLYIFYHIILCLHNADLFQNRSILNRGTMLTFCWPVKTILKDLQETTYDNIFSTIDNQI